ncbi:MAG: DMT family transporter [Actinomycetota bacterium]|nr:DMT family transporter [Actinomycetota bacterium]
MSPATGVAVTLCVLAGLAGPMQAAVMGELGERVGIVPALALSALVTTAIALAALTTMRQGVGEALRQPAWLWTGGAISAFIVIAVTVAPPRIGTTATIGVIIAGNLAMAAAIDRYGLLGQEQIGLGWPRLLGIGLLAAGAALSLHRG